MDGLDEPGKNLCDTVEFHILVTGEAQVPLGELKSEAHCAMSGEEKGRVKGRYEETSF